MIIESALQTLCSRFQKKVGTLYKRAPEEGKRWILNFSKLFICLLLLQCKTNDEILWKNKKQLIIKDFKGGKSYLKKSDKYPLGLLGLTQTRTDYSYKIDSISKLPKYRVQTYFKKKESALRSKKDTTVLPQLVLVYNEYLPKFKR